MKREQETIVTSIPQGVLGRIEGMIFRGKFQLESELELIARRAQLEPDESLLVAITHFPIMAGPEAPNLILGGRVCGRIGFWAPRDTAYVQTDPDTHGEPIGLRVARIARSTADLLDPIPDR